MTRRLIWKERTQDDLRMGVDNLIQKMGIFGLNSRPNEVELAGRRTVLCLRRLSLELTDDR